MSKRGASKLLGFRETSRQLNNMGAAAARGVGYTALAVPAEMLARGVRRRATVLTGDLVESVDWEKAKAKRGRPEVHVIAGDIAAVQEEFGNEDQAAHPFFRPEIDEGEARRNGAFADALMIEVNDAVIRQAIRVAKKAAKG